jgi:hypothetical protein
MNLSSPNSHWSHDKARYWKVLKELEIFTIVALRRLAVGYCTIHRVKWRGISVWLPKLLLLKWTGGDSLPRIQRLAPLLRPARMAG